MTLLDGKVAVVTGAGSGMGRASAQVFVREGARVLAADITGREEETAAALGDAVVPFRCDVTKEEQVEAMFAAALDGFAVTKAAAVEYGTQGIRAISICPGFIETEMSGGPGAAAKRPEVVQGSALKRGGQPGEVAELAAFLCSDRAGFITGAAIPIDGGMSVTLA